MKKRFGKLCWAGESLAKAVCETGRGADTRFFLIGICCEEVGVGIGCAGHVSNDAHHRPRLSASSLMSLMTAAGQS